MPVIAGGTFDVCPAVVIEVVGKPVVCPTAMVGVIGEKVGGCGESWRFLLSSH